MFYLYHHNDLGRLAELLAVLRNHHLRGPFDTDVVLAPNRGIGRWLSIRIAESEGIAANIQVELPGRWIWDLLTACLPQADQGTAFESGRLLWHLYACLPDMAVSVEPVADYLGDPPDEIRRFQLARQLADVFDQYLVYRADLLADWTDGVIPATRPGQWQAQIWQYLTAEHRLGRRHPASMLRAFIRQLPGNTTLQQRVVAHCPSQLYCFGHMALPPDHVRLLYALSEHIDIHFLMPNPSAEYWGDLARTRLPLVLPKDDEPLPGEQRIESAHPLLGNLGRMARDMVRLLYADEFAGIVEPDLQPLDYALPDDRQLLQRIQRDIMRLDCSDSRQGMVDGDTSLECHACHGPLREVQVLQDQILDRLSADDSLHARDIIVMLPDVAAYAPAIEAVFGGAPADRHLPWNLADRAQAASHPIINALTTVLDLPLWRWRASELLELLSIPAVMRRFDLADSELDDVRHWVEQAGIRWGRDGDHRRAMGAGGFEQNSWRFGLDRLLLGVMQSDEDTLIDGVAPWARLEGTQTSALGKLWRFEQTLALAAEELAAAATPQAWQNRLNTLIDNLIAPAPDDADEQRAVDRLRQLFAEFETAQTCMDADVPGADNALSWEAVRDYLQTELRAAGTRQPFPAGGITFCGMVPLRAVPFRMVCILGLNDGDFPRQDENRAFNILYQQPRLGDRNMRDDDRLLFLQALTAARDVFYLSYTGRNVHSGEPMPPSPIVNELLEFLQHTYFRDMPAQTMRDRLVHEQPMQPFSARYFSSAETDARVFTFANDWREATQATFRARGSLPPFLDDSRAELEEPVKEIDLVTLKRFFDHPPKAFFRDRLRMSLPEDEDCISDEEPVSLSPLDAGNLRRRLFDTATAQGIEAFDARASALEKARGHLPPPPLADAAWQEQAAIVNELLPIWRQWQTLGQPGSVVIDLDVNGVRLTGQVESLWRDALRRLRTGRLKTQYRLRYWIDYLAVVAAGHEVPLELAGLTPKTDSTDVVEYAGSIDARTAMNHLDTLIRSCIAGRKRPLHYHPDLDDLWQEKNKLASVDHLFTSHARYPNHLMQDPCFTMLLGNDDAPLGEDEASSPFIQNIGMISGPMNAAIIRREKS